MHLLAVVGLFRKDEAGRFLLTPESVPLRKGVPGSVRAHALLIGEEIYWRMDGDLLHTVRNGQNAFESLYGIPVYEYLAQNRAAAEVFNDYMKEVSSRFEGAIFDAYDFAAHRTVVDVGGGRAGLLIRLLKTHQSMHGVVFDLPHVIEGTRAQVEAEGLAERCTLISGDFFEHVPAGGDAYLLRNVILDWDDERAARILKNCRAAMQPEATLLLSEPVLSEGPLSPNAWYGDLQIMVGSGGRQRRPSEFEALLAAAGFGRPEFISTDTFLSLVKACAV